MTCFRIAAARHATILRNLALALSAVLALASLSASAARAEAMPADAVLAPPAVVIDAEYVPNQPVGLVLYVRHEHDMLAMDATSGAIRAVFPAAPRAAAAPSFSALAAGSVSVPAFGLVLLATAFLAMVGVVFLRRTPAGA